MPEREPKQLKYEKPAAQKAYQVAHDNLRSALDQRFAFTGTKLAPEIEAANEKVARLYGEERVKPFLQPDLFPDLTEKEREGIRIASQIIDPQVITDTKQLGSQLRDAANLIIVERNFDRTPKETSNTSYRNLASLFFGKDSRQTQALTIAQAYGIMFGNDHSFSSLYLDDLGVLHLDFSIITDLHGRTKEKDTLIKDYLKKVFISTPLTSRREEGEEKISSIPIFTPDQHSLLNTYFRHPSLPFAAFLRSGFDYALTPVDRQNSAESIVIVHTKLSKDTRVRREFEERLKSWQDETRRIKDPPKI